MVSLLVVLGLATALYLLVRRHGRNADSLAKVPDDLRRAGAASRRASSTSAWMRGGF